jgi:hypothetical protein
MTNSFIFTFTTNDYTFFDRIWTKAKTKKVPYTGTLLPVLVQVFDHELDFERCDIVKLQKSVDAVVKEGNNMNAKIRASCSKLEPEFGPQIAEIRFIQAEVERVGRKINQYLREKDAKEDQQAFPEQASDIQAEAQEDDSVDDSESQTRNEKLACDLEKQQQAFKKAGSRVKAVYRKIVSLTYEERYGKNEYLRELFDLATFAREHNDLIGLESILRAVKQYHTKQGKLQVLEFLKQKKQALKTSMREIKQQINAMSRSPAYAVHTSLSEGQVDMAKHIFGQMLSTQAEDLRQKLMDLEMRYSGLTGTFTDGSTRKFHRR